MQPILVRLGVGITGDQHAMGAWSVRAMWRTWPNRARAGRWLDEMNLGVM